MPVRDPNYRRAVRAGVSKTPRLRFMRGLTDNEGDRPDDAALKRAKENQKQHRISRVQKMMTKKCPGDITLPKAPWED